MASDDAAMSLDAIKRRGGQFDPASIQYLDYSGCGVRTVANLEPCVCLRVLDLSKNKINNGGCLPLVPMLRDLDLSDNLFHGFQGLEHLPSVRVLKMQGNHIRDLAALEPLRDMPTLKALYLRDVHGGRANPICSHPAYQSTVFKLLPQLETLDGEHSLLRKAAQEVYRAEAEKAEGGVELPPSSPWLEGYSWEDTGVRPPDKATMTRLQVEVQALISEAHDTLKDADTSLAKHGMAPPSSSTAGLSDLM